MGHETFDGRVGSSLPGGWTNIPKTDDPDGGSDTLGTRRPGDKDDLQSRHWRHGSREGTGVLRVGHFLLVAPSSPEGSVGSESGPTSECLYYTGKSGTRLSRVSYCRESTPMG